jgi:TonB-dependent Receptor Plug Domain/CarboxypepD_reg-like domain
MILRFLVIFVMINHSFVIFGQTIVKAKILSSFDKSPVAFATIFVNNTSIGSQANENGKFTLIIPDGINKQVILSSIGFETLVQRVESTTLEIFLKPADNQLADLSVSVKKDKKWQKNYAIFEKVFLGETPAAEKCKVLNPWVIDLKKNEQVYSASANLPIEIENKYLGYSLKWDLKKFISSPTSFSINGNSQFVPMIANSEKEKKIWEENRQSTFEGSLIHFLKCLYQKKTYEKGFRVYVENEIFKGQNRTNKFEAELNVKKRIVEINLDKLVTFTDKYAEIPFTTLLEIHFLEKKEKYQQRYADILHEVSWLENSKKKIRFDENGQLEEVNAMTLSGAMANARMAEMLPIDYGFESKPKQKINLTASAWMHTNKPFYNPGEQIWAKCIINYSTWKISADSLSTLVHVDLLNTAGKTITNQIWELYNGESWGNIYLPDSLSPGPYFIRAYTSQFGDLFYKTIGVVKKGQSLKTKSINSVNEIINSDLSTFGDSVRISIQGLPFHSYSVSIIEKKWSGLLELLKNDTIKLLPTAYIENKLYFKGSVKNNNGKEIKAKINGLISNNKQIIETESNDKGEFQIKNIYGLDTVKLLVKATGKKGKIFNNIIQLKSEERKVSLPNLEKLEFISSTINSNFADLYIQKDSSQLLNEVIIKAKRENIELNDRTNKLYGKADYVVNLSKMNTVAYEQNLLAYLQGRVPGLTISLMQDPNVVGKFVYKVKIRGLKSIQNNSDNTANEPLILVDGIPFEDVEQLSSLSMNQVDRIEVINRIEPIYGSRGANGILAIYTKTNAKLNQINIDVDKDFVEFNIKGINQASDFKAAEGNPITFFWSPYIITDEKGKAIIKLKKTVDLNNYVIQISGQNQSGQLFIWEK